AKSRRSRGRLLAKCFLYMARALSWCTRNSTVASAASRNARMTSAQAAGCLKGSSGIGDMLAGLYGERMAGWTHTYGGLDARDSHRSRVCQAPPKQEIMEFPQIL